MRIQRIGMFAAAAVFASFLVAAWPVNAVNAQSYWEYGVWGYTEDGQVGKATVMDMDTIKRIVRDMSKGLVMHRQA